MRKVSYYEPTPGLRTPLEPSSAPLLRFGLLRCRLTGHRIALLRLGLVLLDLLRPGRYEVLLHLHIVAVPAERLDLLVLHQQLLALVPAEKPVLNRVLDGHGAVRIFL